MHRAAGKLFFAAIAILVMAIGVGFAWITIVDPTQNGIEQVYRGVTVEGAPRPWQFNFAQPASPIQDELYDLHNFLFVINLAICGLVAVLLLFAIWRFRARRNPVPWTTTHNVPLEIAWTIAPVVVLIAIAIPSARALYRTEILPEAALTLKVTAHQWYWDYEYPDHPGVQISSNILRDGDLAPEEQGMRLLAADNFAFVPAGAVVRFQLTSTDVIHAFAVPSLGIKRDAVPGRLSEVWTKIEREGLYFGQCSELCGRDHAFMPIAIKAVSPDAFREWLDRAKAEASKAKGGSG